MLIHIFGEHFAYFWSVVVEDLLFPSKPNMPAKKGGNASAISFDGVFIF